MIGSLIRAAHIYEWGGFLDFPTHVRTKVNAHLTPPPEPLPRLRIVLLQEPQELFGSKKSPMWRVQSAGGLWVHLFSSPHIAVSCNSIPQQQNNDTGLLGMALL